MKSDEKQHELTACNKAPAEAACVSLHLLAGLVKAHPGKDPVHALSTVHRDLQGMEPQDPVEAVLIGQMLLCHEQAMRLLDQANRSSLPESAGQWLGYAQRFLSTYLRQVEALTKYRRKGTQKVVVEHVTVESGGQAIVGNIDGGRGGQR